MVRNDLNSGVDRNAHSLISSLESFGFTLQEEERKGRERV